MQRPIILIADDESYIREFLAEILSVEYRIIFAKNGNEAVEVAANSNPNLILLDISMPEKNGIEVCKELRMKEASKGTPIIMLTALNEPNQRVLAFNSGADDYISKPFLPDELVARIKRKLIRHSSDENTRSRGLSYGTVRLNHDKLNVEIDGDIYDLGQVEYRILNLLLKKRGELVSRQELNQHIWSDELPSDRALDPHITSLRKKLQKSQGEIKTVYGKGYSLIIREKEI